MANTKHSAAREIIIDRLLRERRGYSAMEITDIVNRGLEFQGLPPVSRNSILGDIRNIQYLYKRPLTIERRGRQLYYQYEDPDCTIFTNVLTFGELQLIQSALNSIRYIDPMEGTMMYKELPERVAKILGLETEENPVVIYETPPSLNNLKRFRTLYELILKHYPARISYHTESGKVERNVIVHPYYLLNRENEWYLLCRNETSNRPEKIHLSAIDRIEFADEVEFIPNEDFKLQDYYQKMFSKN